MNKILMNVLLVSVGANVLGSLALVGMNAELEKYKSYYERSRNWGTMMNKIVMSHYKNGGEFLVDVDLESDLEAYLIMARNGLG